MSENKLPPSLEQWIKDEADRYASDPDADNNPDIEIAKHFSDGATAMHTHLSESHEKEIAELKEEINEYSRNLKNASQLLNRQVSYSASLSEQHQQEMQESLLLYNNLTATIFKQEQEIERLNGEIAEVFRSGEEDYQYWSRRCYAAEFLLGHVDQNINKQFIGWKEWQDLVNREPNVQASVATEADSSNADGTQKEKMTREEWNDIANGRD